MLQIANFKSAFDVFLAEAQAEINRQYKQAFPEEHMHPPVLEADLAGARYVRVIAISRGQRAAWCFVDRQTGAVLKCAGWKGPAKNFARGNIFDERHGCGRVRWTGVA